MPNKDEEEGIALRPLGQDKQSEYTAVNIEGDGQPGEKVNANNTGTRGRRKKKKDTPVPKAGKKTATHHAAETGQVQELQDLIRDQPNLVSQPDENCQTPLHLAAKGLHLRCCQELLKVSKKEVNLKDKSGDTPFLISIASGVTSFEITKLLLANSANVKVKNKVTRTAVHIAADRGNVNTLKLLLEKDRTGFDAVDKLGTTPLHLAVRNGHIEMGKVLIAAGANKDAQDNDGCTPLHWASKKGFDECMKMLLSLKCVVDSTDKKGNTPLHMFCSSGKDRPSCAELLLMEKANPNAQNKDGKTPFHLVQSSPYEVKMAFKGYEINLLITDNKKKTVLHYAAERRHSSKHVDYILEMEEMKKINANIFLNARDSQGNTALHIAAKLGELENCKSLLKAGADGNISSKLKGTALHLAAERGYTILCEFFIDKGIKVNAKNIDSLTPLHLAAANGHSECCELIMKKGGQATESDNKKNSVLHSAAEGGHVSCIKVIRDMKSFLLNKPNERGWTPLHITVEKGSVECCKALLTKKTDLWASGSQDVPSPIRLAYEKKFYNIFDCLLMECTLDNKALSKKDIDFRKLMKIALQDSNRQVMNTICESIYWEESLQPFYNSNEEDLDSNSSPTTALKFPKGKRSGEGQNINLSNLVKDHPELAEKMFDRCLPSQKDKTNAGINQVNNDSAENYFKTQYIDEICKQMGDAEHKDENEESLLPSSAPSKIFDPDNGKLLDKVKTNTANHEWRRHHVLACAARRGYQRLLIHPLVTRWVQYKWHKYIRYGYYVSLLLAVLHAILLTVFALRAWDWREMYDKYQLNQSAICKFDTKLVGPEVVALLKEEARLPNAISYAIYAIMILWFLHNIYKIAKIRAVRMESSIGMLCIIANILFLVNFSHCSQETYVREDWQWVAGPFALTLAWFYVHYYLSHHLFYKPMFFNFKLFMVSARDIIVPIVPILMIGYLFYRLTPKGSLTLITDMNWFFVTFKEIPSIGTLILLLLVAIVFLAQSRSGRENQSTEYDWKRAVLAIDMILDFDVLYPYFRRRFYVARISANTKGTSVGRWGFMQKYLPFVQSIQEDTKYGRRTMDKQEIGKLFNSIQENASKSNLLMAGLHNDKANYDSPVKSIHPTLTENQLLMATIQSDLTKINSIMSKYGNSGFVNAMEEVCRTTE